MYQENLFICKENVVRRLSCILLFLILVAAGASAQLPTKGNVFFGYSYNHAEVVSNDAVSLNGWNASLEGNFLPWIGIVGDLGATYGHHVGEHNYLFGPRASLRVGKYRPFAELLIGAAHINVANGFATDTSFANAVGGGLDYQVWGPVSVRGQLDWIHTRFFNNGQNDVRLSTGIAVHF
jgi:hypothetical protein